MRTVALVVSLAFALSVAACGDNLPGNSPPDVADRSAATPEDTPVTINVVAEDPEGAALTFTYSEPANGTITGTGASITYRPDDDFNGSDSFTVTVSDGDNSAEARIAIMVTPVNDDPVAGDDALAADEDAAATVEVATLLANDTDVDGDTLSVTAVGTPSMGTAALDAGVVTYTPPDDFTGTATFTYTVSDGNGGMDEGEVTVTVGGENDPPVGVDDDLTTPEDTVLTIPSTMLTGNDTDAEMQALSVTMVSGASGGTVDLTGGTITFTPTANFNGTGGFDYVVSDGADMDTAHVNVMVTPVNDTPVATAGTATTAEDMAVTITIAATDVDNQPLTFAVAMMPTSGTLGTIMQATPTTATVVYTPNGNFNGSDSFTFTASDGTATSAAAAVMITVTPANDGPTAMGQMVTTAEDMAVTITLAGMDLDGDPLTFGVVGAPTSGTLGAITQASPTTATVVYTPNGNFNGNDSFTFAVNDGTTTSAAAAVMITVTPVNDPPVATAGTATTAEDAAVTITLAGTDADGDPLTFAIAMGPASGTLGTITQASPTTATVVYTPDGDFSGSDSFTFTVNDGTVTSAPAAVDITVTPANDGPVAMAQMVSTPEDTARTITLVGSDVDGDPLTFAVAVGPTSGTLGAITQATPTTATVVYTPNGNFNGNDSFTFTVDDGTTTSAPAAVMITVTPANDAPVANAGSRTTTEESSITLTLTGSDADGDPLTFTATSQPAHGTLGPITQATPTSAEVVYTPAANYDGPDSFTFTVNDGTVDSAPATFSLTVTPVNDPPVAVNDNDTVERNTPRTQPFSFYLSNDSDGGDGGPLTITLVDMAINGSVAITGGNSITFTPDTDYVGAASFRYHVSDGIDTRTAAVSLTVVLTNTPVIAVDDTGFMSPEDTDFVRDASVFTANDIDPDPQTLTVISVQGAQNGTVDLTGTTVTFTPTAEYSGPAQFTYTVSDGFSQSTATVSLTVTPVNDNPDAVDDSATVAEEGSVDVSPLVNDTNDDGPLTVSAFTQGTNGTVTQTLNTLTYAPNPNFNGTDTFTYTAQDPGGLTDTATVTVTVTPVNDGPIFADSELTIPENAPFTINLAATDVDVPAQQLTFTVSNPPDHGTLGTITSTGLTTATVVYTPDANYVGDDFMHFTVSDGAASDLGIVSLHITNVVVCGDGQIEAPETCDDNDAVGGDGCSATCQIETGWSCTGQPSACDTICGDNITIAGEEECDDGNGVDTDGCTTQCQTGTVCAATVAELAAGDRFATDPATGTCYVSFDDEQTTWAAAQTACIAAGGHLAAITSSAEQGVVASVHNLTQEPWIGLADELVEGSFGWITGEPLTFNNFGPGQPDGGDPEDCVNLTALTSTWNDTSCTFIGFTDGRICELAPSTCGDGFLQSSRGEACDDGNTASFDGCSASCQVETLFFSEYVEGSGNNKVVEIANPANAPRDLTGCSLRLYTNGAGSAGATFNLTQTIPARDVLVVCHAGASAAVLANCDVTVATSPAAQFVTNWNGDDAIELICGGAPVDVIGQIGFDPGTEWGTGLQSTADNTLRRKCGVTIGDAIGNNVFDPSIQWGGFANDTVADLGTYTCAP